VVIGEREELLDGDAGRAKGLLECPRRCDPREREHPRARQLVATDGAHPVRLPTLRDLVDGGENRNAGRVGADGADDRRGVFHSAGAGGDDQVRPGERRQRLPQRPRRQERAVAPRVSCARHHDLEILPERPVLERVVENDRRRAEPLHREARRVVTVRADDDRHARQPPRQ